MGQPTPKWRNYMGGFTLLDIGKLAKPATVLIEKISSAVGVIYEPTGIRRKALAEADARKIAAQSHLDISDLQLRALQRLVHQEERKQANIESITCQAISALPNVANTDKLEEDWLAHFFKQCDTVSDLDMQALWSRLLAGEATKPGTYSKRTVSFVATFDKKDAELFTNICQFVWSIEELTPLIDNFEDEIFKKNGIRFETLKHLEDIGLISLGRYGRTDCVKGVSTSYFDKKINLEFLTESSYSMHTGMALLTNIGRELFPICGAVYNEEFFEYMIKKWCLDGHQVLSPLP